MQVTENIIIIVVFGTAALHVLALGDVWGAEWGHLLVGGGGGAACRLRERDRIPRGQKHGSETFALSLQMGQTMCS